MTSPGGCQIDPHMWRFRAGGLRLSYSTMCVSSCVCEPRGSLFLSLAVCEATIYSRHKSSIRFPRTTRFRSFCNRRGCTITRDEPGHTPIQSNYTKYKYCNRNNTTPKGASTLSIHHPTQYMVCTEPVYPSLQCLLPQMRWTLRTSSRSEPSAVGISRQPTIL